MVILDSTVVNISIPSMIRSLDTSLPQIEWVLNAYTLVFAALLVTFGRLGDMYGRRLMFLIGLSIFGVGSAACGLAPNVNTLIVFRVGQAVGAAFMLPATLSLIEVNFPPEKRGAAFGVWGAISGFGLAVGPTLGGLLTQYNWRYIFFINVPIVIFGFIFTRLVVPESKDAGEHRLDWPGVALSATSLIAFNFAMIEGPRRHWDTTVIALLVTSAVLLGTFLVWETRAWEPLVNLLLFKSRTFAAGNVIGLLIVFTIVGTLFVLPLFLQDILRFSPLKAGLSLAPMSFTIMLTGPVAGRLSDRFGSKWLMFAGLAITTASLAWVSVLGPHSSAASLAPRFVLLGLGIGLVVSPMTSAVMGSTPPEFAGAGSGVLTTMQRVGAVMGVAVLGAVLQASVATDFVAALETRAGIAPLAAQRLVAADESSPQGLLGGGPPTPEEIRAALPAATRERIDAGGTMDALVRGVAVDYRDAFVSGLTTTLRVGAAVALLGALLSLLIRPTAGQGGRAGPHAMAA